MYILSLNWVSDVISYLIFHICRISLCKIWIKHVWYFNLASLSHSSPQTLLLFTSVPDFSSFHINTHQLSHHQKVIKPRWHDEGATRMRNCKHSPSFNLWNFSWIYFSNRNSHINRIRKKLRRHGWKNSREREFISCMNCHFIMRVDGGKKTFSIFSIYFSHNSTFFSREKWKTIGKQKLFDILIALSYVLRVFLCNKRLIWCKAQDFHSTSTFSSFSFSPPFFFSRHRRRRLSRILFV